ncbi:MAG: threonine/serine exporter family protein [Tuberibacillus sp.]
MVQQIITSFISSVAFGIIFNVPKKSLIQCGFAGMVGWMFYYVLKEHGINIILATLIGSFWVAIISHIFARRFKTPVIIFSVCGIIPLVPGGFAYDAMRHFVINDYNTALSLAAKVLFMSMAIAIGLMVSEVLNQLLRRWGQHRKEINRS